LNAELLARLRLFGFQPCDNQGIYRRVKRPLEQAFRCSFFPGVMPRLVLQGFLVFVWRV
jgi:hypothetical protein